MTELARANHCIFLGQCLQAYQARWPLCPALYLGSQLRFPFFLLHPSILSSHVKNDHSNLLLSENAGQSWEKFIKCKCNHSKHLCACRKTPLNFSMFSRLVSGVTFEHVSPNTPINAVYSLSWALCAGYLYFYVTLVSYTAQCPPQCQPLANF